MVLPVLFGLFLIACGIGVAWYGFICFAMTFMFGDASRALGIGSCLFAAALVVIGIRFIVGGMRNRIDPR